MSQCPICGVSVEGEEGGPEINAHVDTCLRDKLFIFHPFIQFVYSFVYVWILQFCPTFV